MSRTQIAVAGLALLTSLAAFRIAPQTADLVLYVGVSGVFWLAVAWRVVLLATSPSPPPTYAPVARAPRPPRYTVLVALYREAPIAPQLVRAMAALDYPRDRLEVLFAVEADDPDTAEALASAGLPSFMRVVVVPPGSPRTKPRALNHALKQAKGQFVVVYDAEDLPDPLQLREAAARFAAADADLVCLQAPLRVRKADRGLLQRQFALEYAALFEVMLPAMARLGLPFPLGGTSNHFRAAALRALGGWDAWNVTEDADLGFRIARMRWRTGVLARPTSESPPPTLRAWIPQRARWIKGYVQTWVTHTRRPSDLGLVRGAALHATLGLAVLSALAHGPVLAWLAARLLLHLCAGRVPQARLADLALLAVGWLVAVATLRTGAARADQAWRWRDALFAPLTWALASVAAVYALWQGATRPQHWDKTEHLPDALEPLAALRSAA